MDGRERGGRLPRRDAQRSAEEEAELDALDARVRRGRPLGAVRSRAIAAAGEIGACAC